MRSAPVEISAWTRKDIAEPTTGAGVGVGEGREDLEVIDAKDLLLALIKLETDGGTGGRHVLEGSGSRKRAVESSRELLDKGPRVEGVKKVDVTRGAREDCGKCKRCDER